MVLPQSIKLEWKAALEILFLYAHAVNCVSDEKKITTARRQVLIYTNKPQSTCASPCVRFEVKR